MKTDSRQQTGQKGERLAARFLKRAGYRIILRNRHFGRNELDLVVKDKSHIAFVEVKTRSYENADRVTERPSLAVDKEKRKRTIAAAFAYLRAHPTSLSPRFDVVEVYLDRSKRMKPFKIHHIPDAFHANGGLR